MEDKKKKAIWDIAYQKEKIKRIPFSIQLSEYDRMNHERRI